MKVGDLVSITHGEHRGRIGLIVFHRPKRAAWTAEMYDVLVGGEKPSPYTSYQVVKYASR
jgi:hypothetical protein